jgi:excisionase family DNA binding protein
MGGDAMDIKITTEGTKTTLTSPYHPDLPAAARKLGGRFDGATKAWKFDARDESRVRDLARQVYGTDGDTAIELVTVRLDLDRLSDAPNLWFAGREVARRPGRDDSVRLGENVIVIEGGFAGSGGSMKYPRLVAKDGTILEVRDLPRAAVEAEDQDGVTIVGEQGPDVDALLAERERLLVRLAEIDEQLPEPEGTEATTREAAAALGVSVRTVQRWAAKGKVAATKDDHGRWVITITVGK